MKSHTSYWSTAKQELLTPKVIYIAIPIAALYCLLTLYSFNYRLLLNPEDPPLFKLKLLIALLPGFTTMFTPFDLSLLMITALLVGINTMLAISTIRRVKQQGSITLSVGGASIIGLASAGCSTCGISLFALFGLSAAVSSLPFHGLELHVLAVILLLISVLYMLKKLHEEIYCKVKRRERFITVPKR